ncbi:unnamed protein product [Hermetia illucens]|uniref:Chitin-binding type-2 domain-containing protein n=1 Tax=Hermetia illucens TaxID=343691 RepID=A0A7R8YPA7_HERIL|nr:unnamed protein product [Hermetia illucens]
MKIKIGLILLGVVALIAADQQCSSGSSKVPAFPQDPSCFITNYYLECNNGVATVKKCPSGYLFDSGECLQFGDCATIDMPCICS